MSPSNTKGFLLDTCVVIDLAGEPDRVAEPVRTLFAEPSSRLFLSAASAWEVAIKTERGRLPNGATLIENWDQHREAMHAETLAITHPDAFQAGALDWVHRDPFDRMLVAQAGRAGLLLATRDHKILDSGLVPTLDTRT